MAFEEPTSNTDISGKINREADLRLCFLICKKPVFS